MDNMITVDQLATTDLRTINEIWLGGSSTAQPEQAGLCLWREEQVFTHDMLSEGTHDQNTRRLLVKMDNPEDQTESASIEARVRELLVKMDKQGEFYPAERVDTHG